MVRWTQEGDRRGVDFTLLCLNEQRIPQEALKDRLDLGNVILLEQLKLFMVMSLRPL